MRIIKRISILITVLAITLVVAQAAEAAITVSGTAFQNDEATDVGDGSNTYNLALRVNGDTASTTTTHIDTGVFSFSDISVNAGDTITIYFYGASNSTAGTYTGNFVTISDGSNITGVQLYDDHVVVRSDNSTTAITIDDLVDYDNDQNSANLLFDAENATPDTLSIESGVELFIPTGEPFTPGGDVTVGSGGLDLNGTWTETGTETLTITYGNFDSTGGTFTKATGTVLFPFDTTITGSQTFNNVTFNTTSANDAFTIASGTILTVNGTLTCSGTGNQYFNTGDIYAQGDITVTNTGTSGGGSATITINGTGDQTLTGSGTVGQGSLPKLTINKATSGNLTYSSVISIANDYTYTALVGTLTTTNSTMAFVLDLTITGSHTLNNVTFNTTSANDAFTIASGTILTVNGTLTCSGTGNQYFNTGDIYAQGDITVTNTGTSGGGSATITINGTGAQLFTGSGTAGQGRLCNVTIDKSSGTLTLSSIISEAKVWTYTAGTVDATTNDSTVVFYGTNNLDGQGTSATMDFDNLQFEGTTTLTGNLNVAGNWDNNSSVVTGTNTVTFTTNSSATIDTGGVAAGNDFQTLTIDKSGGSLQLTTNHLDVDGTLTITAGTLDLNSLNISTTTNIDVSGTLKLTGDETLSATPTNNSGSTVEYSATSGTRNIKDWTYHHLKINGSGGTFTTAAAQDETLGGDLNVSAGTFDISTNATTLTVTGTLTVDGGTLTATSGTIDANGAVSITSGILTAPNGERFTVAGSWTNSGTFTHSSGTVIFDTTATATIAGSTTFNNFKSTTAGKTINFTAGTTQTINGTLTLTGASGNNIFLRSTSTPTQWNINNVGDTESVSYVDVKDSNNTGSVITASNSTNSLNNQGWSFGVSYLKITASSSTITAGSSLEITITAYDSVNTVDPGYTGAKSLTFSGLANAPNGTVPTVKAVNLGTATSITFTSGVSNANASTLIAYKAETASLDVTDETVSSTGDPSYDLDLTVNAGTKNKLLWVTQPSSSVTAGATWTSFSIEITDQYENRTSDTDNITVAPSSGSFTGTSTKAAVSGLATFNDISYNTATTITVTGSATGLTSTPVSSSVVVNPASDNYLKITGTASMTAGGTNTITITTYDAYNNIATGYTGDKSLTFSGANPSPNNTNPTCRDKNSQDINFGTTTTVTFSSAVGTCVMKLYESGFPAIDVTNGTISSFGSEDYDLNVNVAADDLSNFLVNAPATANSGTAFSTTITSRDQYNNTTSSVSGSATLSVDQSSTVSPSSIAASEFTDDGIYTGNLTISNITEQPSITLTATNGSSTGSDTITVSGVPAAPTIGTGQALTSTSIRWNFFDNSSYETGFKLYDNTDTEIVSSSNTNLTYLDETNLTPNTQYSGRYVKAFNAIGNSAASSAATAIYTLVNIPTTLTTVADSTDQITLSWSANSNPSGTGYYAENTTANTNSGWTTTTSWQSTGLTCATSYSFKVKARNGEGTKTSFTDTTTITTQSCPVTGGGGGLPPDVYNLPSQPQPSPENPQGGFRVLINDGAEYTNSPTITLKLFGGPNTERMAISNFPDFRGAGQEKYQTSKPWNLCQGKTECPEGEYLVYAKFYTQYGVASEVVSDSIVYRKEKPIVERIKEIPGKIVEEIIKIPEKIKEIIIPRAPEEVKPPEVPIEELVPEEVPLVFQGQWQLLASEPIRAFVLSPLPKEIRRLAEKFPELGETLERVGITKITDIEKLKAVKLTLPAIKEREELPTDIVFAKTGAEKIDLSIILSLDEKGKPEQRIQTISNKPLQLAVKPDKPVESVKGYLVFKSKISPSKVFRENLGGQENQIPKIQTKNEKIEILGAQISLDSLLSSLLFAWPSFAKEYNPTEIETRLVLLEFEYTDPDGDGIYTAEINAPIVEGEYEIITVMDFEDPELGMKEIRLIIVVDPEGYVYERIGEKRAWVPGAIVSLYWLNPETKQYQLWPAKEYQQGNPQITDDAGKYSFLVPLGTYYLKVEHPNYPVYQSETFVVKEGSGLHFNIELKTKFWWLRAFGWQSIIITILILIIILLAYNFYRDKIRERFLKT